MPQRPVGEVDDGQAAGGRDPDVFAFGVVGVPLAEAPWVGRGGVEEVPDRLFGVLGEFAARTFAAGVERRTAYGGRLTGAVGRAARPCP